MSNADTELVRVIAPHFVAGIVFQYTFKGYECIRAAPILKYCLGKSWPWCQQYFARKGWKASIVH